MRGPSPPPARRARGLSAGARVAAPRFRPARLALRRAAGLGGGTADRLYTGSMHRHCLRAPTDLRKQLRVHIDVRALVREALVEEPHALLGCLHVDAAHTDGRERSAKADASPRGVFAHSHRRDKRTWFPR